eukprot:c469_g1_i1.p1 GENE.c469_g1_i1~~c469_g1_i1.p1  ORF type:complete len:258 (+),score=38.68 c469_g1_i1:393-1166(+)
MEAAPLNELHVQHLVNLLMYVAQKNDPNEPYDVLATPFHCAQNEPLVDLVLRLNQHIRCSPSCYAAALVYIDRVTESNPDLPLNGRTVNLLFTTSLLLANQFLDDKSERALQFANVARIHPVTMANLKTDFLFRVRFHLILSEIDLHGYSDKLQGPFSTQYFEQTGMWNGILKIPVSLPMYMPVTKPEPVAAAPAGKRYSRFMTPFFKSHASQKTQKSVPMDAKMVPAKRASHPFGPDQYLWAANQVDSLAQFAKCP